MLSRTWPLTKIMFKIIHEFLNFLDFNVSSLIQVCLAIYIAIWPFRVKWCLCLCVFRMAERGLFCDKCGKTFSYRASFRRHTQAHDNLGRFVCCERAFPVCVFSTFCFQFKVFKGECHSLALVPSLCYLIDTCVVSLDKYLLWIYEKRILNIDFCQTYPGYQIFKHLYINRYYS